MTCRHCTIHCLHLVGLALVAGLHGCATDSPAPSESGITDNTQPASGDTSSAHGTVRIRVNWPTSEVGAREIPAETQDLLVELSQGGSLIRSTHINQPPYIAEVTGVPVGLTTITATAYANADGTGDVLASGTAEVTVVEGVNDIARLLLTPTAAAEPVLAVGPVTLDFGSLLSSLTFSVSNGGRGLLTWSCATSISQGSPPGWLVVSPPNGMEDGVVTVGVDRDLLNPGSYAGQIQVTSNGGSVTVDVIAIKSRLGVAPTVLEFDATETQKTIQVDNTGSGDLAWTCASPQSWIAASPTSGTNAGEVTVTVDLSALYGGTYVGELEISSSAGDIAVSVIARRAQIGVDSTEFDLEMETSKSLNLRNLGEGTLEWSASTSEPWLTVSPESGTGDAALQLTANRWIMPEGGPIPATVNVQSNGGDVALSVSAYGQPVWAMENHDRKNTGRSPFLGPQDPVVPDDPPGLPIDWASLQLINVLGEVHRFTEDEFGTILILSYDGSTDSVRSRRVGPTGTGGALSPDGRMYFQACDEFTGERSVGWSPPSMDTFSALAPGSGGAGAAMVGPDGTVVFEGDCVVRPDGSILPGAPGDHCPAIGDDGTIYTASQALNPDLTVRFDYEKAAFHTPALGDDGTIYMGSYALHADGSLWWDTGLLSVGTPALAQDGTTYFWDTDCIVHCVSATGTERWQTEGAAAVSDIVLDAECTAYIHRSPIYLPDTTQVVALDTEGNQKWLVNLGWNVGGNVLAIGPDGSLWSNGLESILIR